MPALSSILPNQTEPSLLHLPHESRQKEMELLAQLFNQTVKEPMEERGVEGSGETRLVSEIAPERLKEVSVKTMRDLSDLSDAFLEGQEELLELRDAILNGTTSDLGLRRASAFINWELFSFYGEMSRRNMSRDAVIRGYFGSQENLMELNQEFFQSSSHFFQEDGVVLGDNFTIPELETETMGNITNGQMLNLRLDVVGILYGFTASNATFPTFNFTQESSLSQVCVQTIQLLAGPTVGELDPSEAIAVRQEILNTNSTLYSQSSAGALLYLESYLSGIPTNTTLSDSERVEAYLDYLKTHDLFEPIPQETSPTEVSVLFEEEGSFFRARIHAYETLLGGKPEGLSEYDILEQASKILDSTAEDYDEGLAKEFLNFEADIWAEEAIPGVEELTRQEITSAYLHQISRLEINLEIPPFKTRHQFAEEYINRHYSGERYYKKPGPGVKLSSPIRVDRIEELLDQGATNGIDAAYYSQWNSFFERGSPTSVIPILSEASFIQGGGSYVEFIRPVRRMWVVDKFIPFHYKVNNPGPTYIQIQETGLHIYSAKPVLFETTQGRMGIVFPNGKVSFFDESPVSSNGEFEKSAIGTALGIWRFNGKPHTSRSVLGYDLNEPFHHWDIRVYSGSELVSPRVFVERNLQIKTEEDIGKLEQKHYSETKLQSFFNLIPFLKFGLDQKNGAHSRIDFVQLGIDIFDSLLTLASIGIPVIQAGRIAAKAALTGTRSLSRSLSAITKLSRMHRLKLGAALFTHSLGQQGLAKHVAKEAVDFIIPVFSTAQLLKLGGSKIMDLVSLLRRRAKDLIETRGLRFKVLSRSRTRKICKRSLGLGCQIDIEATQKQLGTGMAEAEETMKDTLFEFLRKDSVDSIRKQVKEASSKNIKKLRQEYDEKRKGYSKVKNRKKASAEDKEKARVAAKEAYEELGKGLLEQERAVLSHLENQFRTTIADKFNEILKSNPEAKREDFVDLPEVKLELDVSDDAIGKASPTIRIIGEGERNGGFFLKFANAFTVKAPGPYRLTYSVEFNDLKGTLRYGIEKASPRSGKVPPLIISEGDAPRYNEIMRQLFGIIESHLGNDQRKMVKLMRSFLDTGSLPTAFRDLPFSSALEERLSTLFVIVNVSEEARAPGTGSGFSRLLRELYKPSEDSFLRAKKWDGSDYMLTFKDIFDPKSLFLSFMSPKSAGKQKGAKYWREKQFTPNKARASIAKRKLQFDDLPKTPEGAAPKTPEGAELKMAGIYLPKTPSSQEQRALVMGLRQDSLKFQSPIKRKKGEETVGAQEGIASESKGSLDQIDEGVIHQKQGLHLSLMRQKKHYRARHIIVTTDEKPSWKKIAVVGIPVIMVAGPVASVVIGVPLGTCFIYNKWLYSKKESARCVSEDTPLLEGETVLVGFPNVGNNCFINGILQILFNCPELVQHIVLADEQHLVVKQQYKKYQEMQEGSIRSIDLASPLREIKPEFRGVDQHDAFSFLIEVLIEPLEVHTENPLFFKVEDWTCYHDFEKYKDQIEHHFQDNQGKIMQGICSSLSISLPSNGADLTVEGLIKHNFHEEFLEDTDTTPVEFKGRDGKPVYLRPAMKKTRIAPPPFIFVDFKRHVVNGEQLRSLEIIKNRTPIDFKEKFILLSEYSLEEVEVEYEWFALLMHEGSVETGHYFTCFRGENKDYYKCDDEEVTKISQQEFIDNGKICYGGFARRK